MGKQDDAEIMVSQLIIWKEKVLAETSSIYHNTHS